MRTQCDHIVVAGLLLAAAGVALGQADTKPDLQLIENGLMVTPVRIAPVVMDHGSIVFLDEWMDYQGSTMRDISSVGVWALPESKKGSYSVSFLTDNGNMPATCAQTLLWGASNSTGGDPDGPGEQGPMQFDDDNNNQFHEADECVDYALGVCPDPLGTLIQFWGTRENPPRPGDFDRNGVIDTRDVLAFLNAWNNCEPRADCNLDGQCDTQDITCFLNGWTMCR